VTPYDRLARLGDADPIVVLRATPVRVEALLHDPRFDPQQSWRPGGDDGRTLIARLADREIAFAFHGRQAVAASYRPEEGPYRAEPVDAAAWGRDYARLDPSLAAAAFGSVRSWNLAWLARLDLADWLAPCRTEDGSGSDTIDELVRAQAAHDLASLERLEGVLGG